MSVAPEYFPSDRTCSRSRRSANVGLYVCIHKRMYMHCGYLWSNFGLIWVQANEVQRTNARILRMVDRPASVVARLALCDTVRRALITSLYNAVMTCAEIRCKITPQTRTFDVAQREYVINWRRITHQDNVFLFWSCVRSDCSCVRLHATPL